MGARKRRAKKVATAEPVRTPNPAPGSRRLLLIGVGVLVVLGAAAALLVPKIRSQGSALRDPDLSVLLISIDTLRADALGAYGHPSVATPWMDRLAREGVRFETAHAHNVITLPSHANLLSGLYPLRHGVRDNSGFRVPPDTETLATRLRAKGYRTAAFVSAFPLDSRFGLDRGFDVYDDRLGAGSQLERAFEMAERRGPSTVAAAVSWLESQQGSKTFCFVHLYEPHFPYEPPEPFATRFRADRYHGEVSATDAALETLLRPLLDAGASGRTLVILTADHGEALGEHGEETHGIFAYEATLRVPLIFYAPRILRPAVVGTPVRHVDVVPTVLDALGQAVPPDLPGRSLLSVAAGGSEAAPSYFEALSSSLNQGWAPLRGVLRDGVKYVDLPLPELYDLRTDPREEKNLAATEPEALEAMRALLARFRAEDRGVERGAEDEATLERLRALGYVAGANVTPKERYTEADDPKRLMGIDARSRDIVRLHRERRFDEAIGLAKQSLAERPDMPLAWQQLAYLERARGDLAAGLAAAKKAFALKPFDAETASILSVYLLESGRAKEALELVGSALTKSPDLDLLTAQGMAFASLGRRAEALAAFERARELDPSNAMVLVNIGTVHLRAGEVRPAREAFEAALRIDPGSAKAQNSLGVIAASEGRHEDAIQHWRRGVVLDPGDYQALFNLGATLRSQGRPAEARPYLEAYLRQAPMSLERRDIDRVRGWLGETGGGGSLR